MELLQAETVKKMMEEGALLIDTRRQESFLEGFLEGAVFVPFTDTFIQRFQQLGGEAQQVILVADEATIPELIKAVRYSGVRQPLGFFSGNYALWQEMGLATDVLIGIEADEFAMDYKFDEFYLIDVRPAEEYAQEHAEDSELIELQELERVSIDLDSDRLYYLYGNTPAEAITAGSILKKNGFQRVRVANANLEAIKKAEIPWFVHKKNTLNKNTGN